MSNNIVFKNIITEIEDNNTKETTTILTIDSSSLNDKEKENLISALHNNVNSLKVNELKEIPSTVEPVSEPIKTETNTTTEVTETPKEVIKFEPVSKDINLIDPKYSKLGSESYNFDDSLFVGNTDIYIDNTLVTSIKDSNFPTKLTDDVSVYMSSGGDLSIINNSLKDHLVTFKTKDIGDRINTSQYDSIVSDKDSIEFWLSPSVDNTINDDFNKCTNSKRSNIVIAHGQLDTPVTLTVKLDNKVIGLIPNYSDASQIASFFSSADISGITFYNSSENQTAIFNKDRIEHVIKFQTTERHVDLIEYWIKEQEGVFTSVPEANTWAFKLFDQLKV